MGWILDLIVVLIILVIALISAKRGFVRVFLELMGFIAAVIISFTFSTPLAELTYDKIVEPNIVSEIADSVNSVADNSATNTIDDTWESLPKIVKNNADKIGMSKEELNKLLTENIGNGIDSVVDSTSENVIRPLVVTPLRLVYILLMLVFLIFVVRTFARLINKLFKFSIVGKLNFILGGIVGIPQGIIFAMVFCILVLIITSFTAKGFWIFTSEAVSNSWVFNNFNFKI